MESLDPTILARATTSIVQKQEAILRDIAERREREQRGRQVGSLPDVGFLLQPTGAYGHHTLNVVTNEWEGPTVNGVAWVPMTNQH